MNFSVIRSVLVYHVDMRVCCAGRGLHISSQRARKPIVFEQYQKDT